MGPHFHVEYWQRGRSRLSPPFRDYFAAWEWWVDWSIRQDWVPAYFQIVRHTRPDEPRNVVMTIEN